MSPQAFLGWDHFSVFPFLSRPWHFRRMSLSFVQCFPMIRWRLCICTSPHSISMSHHWGCQSWSLGSGGAIQESALEDYFFPFGILRQWNTLFLFKLLPTNFWSTTINYMQNIPWPSHGDMYHPQSFSIYELEFFCRRGLSLLSNFIPVKTFAYLFYLQIIIQHNHYLSCCPSDPCFGRRAPLLLPVWLPCSSFMSLSSSEGFLPPCPHEKLRLIFLFPAPNLKLTTSPRSLCSLCWRMILKNCRLATEYTLSAGSVMASQACQLTKLGDVKINLWFCAPLYLCLCPSICRYIFLKKPTSSYWSDNRVFKCVSFWGFGWLPCPERHRDPPGSSRQQETPASLGGPLGAYGVGAVGRFGSWALLGQPSVQVMPPFSGPWDAQSAFCLLDLRPSSRAGMGSVA